MTFGDTPKPVPYGEFVDWDKRLEREGPFFRRLFEEVGVRSVVDVGAGTARHAIMFASWGLNVVAVDPSESMLEQAEDNLLQFADEIESGSGSVRLQHGGFGELAAIGVGPAEALISTGNALPHIDGPGALHATLNDFRAVVSVGGVLVLHLLNHTRLLETHVRTIPPKVRATQAGTRVFLRVMDYPSDDFIDFSFLTLTRDDSEEWSLEARVSPHTALPHTFLVAELAASGWGLIELFGGHDRQAFDAARDESLIVVARAV